MLSIRSVRGWHIQVSVSVTSLPLRLNINIIQGVRYYPKGIFPRATSQVTISQVATSQMCNFPKVRLGPLRRRRLQQVGGRVLWLGWTRKAERCSYIRLGAERCGQDRLGKLPLRKLHMWEVATWEKTFRKVPNIVYFVDFCLLERTIQKSVINDQDCSNDLYFFSLKDQSLSSIARFFSVRHNCSENILFVLKTFVYLEKLCLSLQSQFLPHLSVL